MARVTRTQSPSNSGVLTMRVNPHTHITIHLKKTLTKTLKNSKKRGGREGDRRFSKLNGLVSLVNGTPLTLKVIESTSILLKVRQKKID